MFTSTFAAPDPAPDRGSTEPAADAHHRCGRDRRHRLHRDAGAAGPGHRTAAAGSDARDCPALAPGSSRSQARDAAEAADAAARFRLLDEAVIALQRMAP